MLSIICFIWRDSLSNILDGLYLIVIIINLFFCKIIELEIYMYIYVWFVCGFVGVWVYVES